MKLIAKTKKAILKLMQFIYFAVFTDNHTSAYKSEIVFYTECLCTAFNQALISSNCMRNNK